MVFDFLSLKKQKTSPFFTFSPHILLYFALEARHTKFGDPNLIILSFDFLSLKKSKNVPKKPQNKKNFSHIRLYFALEAKHSKFGDPNLITLGLGFLSLKNEKRP